MFDEIFTCQCPPKLVQQESVAYAHGVSSLTVAEVGQDSTLLHILSVKQNTSYDYSGTLSKWYTINYT